MSTDARRTARRATHVADVEALEDDTIILIEDLASGSLPDAIKIRVLGEIRSLVEKANVTGAVDPSRLASTGVLALGAGPTGSAPAASTPAADTELANRLRALASSFGAASADDLLSYLAAMLAPLTRLTPGESDARMKAMERVANGTIRVERDGTLVAQHELDDLRRDFGPIRAALPTSPRDRQSRLDGMLRIADGRTPVNRDGTPDITSVGRTHGGGISADDQRKLDAANKVVFGRSATGKPVITNEGTLSDADRRALGIPPRR